MPLKVPELISMRSPYETASRMQNNLQPKTLLDTFIHNLQCPVPVPLHPYYRSSPFFRFRLPKLPIRLQSPPSSSRWMTENLSTGLSYAQHECGKMQKVNHPQAILLCSTRVTAGKQPLKPSLNPKPRALGHSFGQIDTLSPKPKP